MDRAVKRRRCASDARTDLGSPLFIAASRFNSVVKLAWCEYSDSIIAAGVLLTRPGCYVTPLHARSRYWFYMTAYVDGNLTDFRIERNRELKISMRGRRRIKTDTTGVHLARIRIRVYFVAAALAYCLLAVRVSNMSSICGAIGWKSVGFKAFRFRHTWWKIAEFSCN